MSFRKLKVTVGEPASPNPNVDGDNNNKAKRQTVALGNGSEVVFIPRLISFDQAWKWFDSCLQPRATCYVASPGLPQLVYSGYQAHAYSWDDHPPLKQFLEAVHKALPGSSFNSLLLNRYKGGNDYVGWHSDDEKLYGSTPEIASLSLGCDREFFLKKKKPSKTTVQERRDDEEPTSE